MIIKNKEIKNEFINYLVSNQYSLYYNNESMGHYIFVHKDYTSKYINLNYEKVDVDYARYNNEFDTDLSCENTNSFNHDLIYINFIIKKIDSENGIKWKYYKDELLDKRFIWEHNDNLFKVLLNYEIKNGYKLKSETKLNIINAEVDDVDNLEKYEKFISRDSFLIYIQSIDFKDMKEKINFLSNIYNKKYIEESNVLSVHLYEAAKMIKKDLKNNKKDLEQFKYMPLIANDFNEHEIDNFFIKKDILFNINIDLKKLKKSLINYHPIYVEDILFKYINNYINNNDIYYEKSSENDEIKINFYLKNKNHKLINKEQFQKDMIDFVNYLNSNIIELNNKGHNEYMNYIDKYIYEYILNKESKNIKNNINKSKKI